jgi:hypothetical protein
MKEFQDSSNEQRPSGHARRDFLSLSLLAGSTLLLSAESRGQAPVTENDERAITNTVGLADSIALYANLLEDVRRLVLQKDALKIHIAKYEATEWLGKTSDQARRLRATLEGAALTGPQKSELSYFLSETAAGGDEMREALIRMRREPLEEIRNLDADFDKIRADLTAASNALKNRQPGVAKEGIASAISRLDKYTPSIESNPGVPPGQQQQGQSQMQPQSLPAYRPIAVPASSLRELLQTVLAVLNAAPNGPSDRNHSRGYGRASYEPIAVEPLLRSEITGVLRNRLNPASWLQVGIGYAVAFPILLRVSDKSNRQKLLYDALRLVPPGLRGQTLKDLADDLANLP